MTVLKMCNRAVQSGDQHVPSTLQPYSAIGINIAPPQTPIIIGKGAFRLVVKDAAFEFVIHSLLVMLKIAIPLVVLETIVLILGVSSVRYIHPPHGC